MKATHAEPRAAVLCQIVGISRDAHPEGCWKADDYRRGNAQNIFQDKYQRRPGSRVKSTALGLAAGQTVVRITLRVAARIVTRDLRSAFSCRRKSRSDSCTPAKGNRHNVEVPGRS